MTIENVSTNNWRQIEERNSDSSFNPSDVEQILFDDLSLNSSILDSESSSDWEMMSSML